VSVAVAATNQLKWILMNLHFNDLFVLRDDFLWYAQYMILPDPITGLQMHTMGWFDLIAVCSELLPRP